MATPRYEHLVVVTFDGEILHHPENSLADIEAAHPGKLRCGRDGKPYFWVVAWSGRGVMPKQAARGPRVTWLPPNLPVAEALQRARNMRKMCREHFERLSRVLATGVLEYPFDGPDYVDVFEQLTNKQKFRHLYLRTARQLRPLNLLANEIFAESERKARAEWNPRPKKLRGRDHEGFDVHGRDRQGYDHEGFNCNGRDRGGYDREGFNAFGRDRGGYDREGFNAFDRDRRGQYKPVQCMGLGYWLEGPIGT